MPDEPRRLKDPRELRAIAHPLRMAILEQLTMHGPLTATELSERLGESPANCSWHLRKLAEHNFVEEAESTGGRRRPWQVSSIGMGWNQEDDADAETLMAGHALTRMWLERWVDRFLTAEQAVADKPEWRRAATLSQSATWLTADELAEMNAEMSAVMMRHLDRLEDPSKRPEGAQLCELVGWGAPVDPSIAGESR
ncbi:winged helix-turn-helix domain-containing protein [Nocardioides houyundeii]|uniref:winged helix-turn-helix domain-containing protein n=1 Tax=Nocardioides houyundeii TaxID=2045452 RepID=UPI000C75C33A|nr:helix-turn-helix domain-containing protein [Nocardioides houyundeii]